MDHQRKNITGADASLYFTHILRCLFCFFGFATQLSWMQLRSSSFFVGESEARGRRVRPSGATRCLQRALWACGRGLGRRAPICVKYSCRRNEFLTFRLFIVLRATTAAYGWVRGAIKGMKAVARGSDLMRRSWTGAPPRRVESSCDVRRSHAHSVV